MARRKPQQYAPGGPLLAGLRERLPFSLTPAQERVLAELIGDLGRPFPMQRLLQGDVGCGKTLVMACLTALAAHSGYQVAWMAPTELLAEQHARTLNAWLGPLGVSWVVLSQGLPAAQRQRSLTAIAEGRAAVVIGTHALIQTRVTFKRLALVIIDEQHKFGVSQRALLARKGGMPDVLVVTATPIPRTMALSLYGDLDVSTIDELPPGRRAVQTVWMPERRLQDVYALVRRHLAQGRQGYVVYPRVKEGGEDGGPDSTQALKAATSMARHLQRVFGEFRVGLLHGQMRAQDKARAMRAFERREIHLLVTTVIVEVGLDVSNATIMVIEHPEHFGLAQLHQLRGRIGRGEHPATCVVVSDAQEEPVRRRLEAFVQTTDGFALAEQDLSLRGPGELLGARQHGWMRLRIADLGRDRTLLELAQRDARDLAGVAK
jgi:ATP-dependent DNA helicase RecG